MPPNTSGDKSCIFEEQYEDNDSLAYSLSAKIAALKMEQKKNECLNVDEIKLKEKRGLSSYFETKLKWNNIIHIAILHGYALHTIITFPYSQKKLTAMFALLGVYAAAFGVTAGAHRLWTHRAFKAKWPLRIILLSLYYLAAQGKLFGWVRDHRVHHKYSDTNADPHNSRRGFFFSHVGWLMMKKRPEVIKSGRQIDMSDITSDPIVAFGDKYFTPLRILSCFIIPTLIPVLLWNEEWYYSFSSQIVRYVLSLNITWNVNSIAHMWGTKPYDKNIFPVENKFIALTSMGEGWHNYHHVFPWDYKAAELGSYGLNFTTALLDMFAKIGWAYDLKEPSKELVISVIKKRGESSHPTAEPEPEPKSN